MRLLTIESATEIKSLGVFLRSNFDPGFDFYINAKRIGGVWKTTDLNEPLNNAVTPIVENGDDCLFIASNETFPTGVCTKPFYPICQYIKNI